MNNFPEALPAGTQLGEDYTILRVLGQGGFGITYLAQDEIQGEEVVIKENMPDDFAVRDRDTMRVLPRRGQEEDFAWARERFLDEARVLYNLKHPNIVSVSRAFSALNTAYYVMPRVGCGVLGEFIDQKHGSVNEATLAPLLRRLLGALAYIHSQNLLHRDLKPSNILMTAEGEPVIIDFGAARAVVSTRTQTILETPGYTPVEQLKSHGNVGPWTDLYSLGATFYHLITGERPPRGLDRQDDEDHYIPLTVLPELQGRFSYRFLASIDKALAVRPAKRWQTAQDWAAALPAPPAADTSKSHTKQTSAEEEESVAKAELQGQKPKKRPLWCYLLALLSLFAMVAGGILLTEQTPTYIIPHDDDVRSVAFSPDGKWLATGCDDCCSRIIDTATGKIVQTTPHGRHRVTSVAFSPDGKRLTTGCMDKNVRLIEITTGKVQMTIPYEREVRSVAFSPDGKYLATACGNDLYINDAANGETKKVLPHFDLISSVVYSADGKYLATGTEKEAYIFDVGTYKPVLTIPHGDHVLSVAFSPDGTRLSTGCDDDKIRLIDTATGVVLQLIPLDYGITDVSFSPNGKWLVTGGYSAEICIINAATGKAEQSFSGGTSIFSIAFSPDGKWIATGGVHRGCIYRINLPSE